MTLSSGGFRGLRERLRRPAATLVVCVLGVTVAGAALDLATLSAHANVLSSLREKNVNPTAINPQDLQRVSDGLQGKLKFTDIRNFGRVEFLSWPMRKTVKWQNAGTIKDLPIYLPPSALSGYKMPVVEKVNAAKIRFTLKVKPINQFLLGLGAMVQLPLELDGKPFLVTSPPMVRFRYKSDKAGAEVIILETTDPKIEAGPGVNMATARQALLSVPGFPSQLKAQLAGIDELDKSDPITVAAVGSVQRTTVNGIPATFLSWRNHQAMAGAASEAQMAARQELHREAADAFGGGVWEHPGEAGNILTWRMHTGVVIAVQGNLTLERARAIAEQVK